MPEYLVKCWFCLMEYDALSSAWCSHGDQTKVCPYCLRCFCQASDEYRQNFFAHYPKDEQQEIGRRDFISNLKLGELLVRAGKISEAQLEEALVKQRTLKKKIGEILVMMSLLTPDELQLYLLSQKSVDQIDLKTTPLDFELIRRFGSDFCLDHLIVPIEVQEIRQDRILRFAFCGVESLKHLKKDNRFNGFRLVPYLAKKEDIEVVLNNLEAGDRNIRVYTSEDGIGHVAVIERIIKSAIASMASDIYFELKAGKLAMTLRIGEDTVSSELPPLPPEEFFTKVKQVAGIKKDLKNEPQKSAVRLSEQFSQFAIRTFYYRGTDQENIRFRIVYQNVMKQSIANLDLSSEEQDLIRDELQRPKGLYLVIGPHFNRVSETLHALMNSLKGERIASVETMLLLRREGCFQLEIDSHEVDEPIYRNLIFFKPTSLFLFDYFQKSYAPLFLEFARTGKLFLECNGYSYEEVFEKLSEEYNIPFDFICENLRLTVFQKLVKQLCPHCKKKSPQSAAELLKHIRLSKPYSIYQEKGCGHCDQTGFLNRQTFFEIFALKDDERPNFTPKSIAGLKQKISEAGNLTISQKAVNAVLKGEISYNEYRRIF